MRRGGAIVLPTTTSQAEPHKRAKQNTGANCLRKRWNVFPSLESSPMIRFQCPTCRKVLKAPDHGAGRKIPCPRCGQRLQIPFPVQHKTILGQFVSDPTAPSPVQPSAIKPAGAVPSHGQVLIDCPCCKRPVQVHKEAILLGRWVECPKCRMGFAASMDEVLPASCTLAAPPSPTPPSVSRQPPCDPPARRDRLDRTDHRPRTGKKTWKRQPAHRSPHAGWMPTAIAIAACLSVFPVCLGASILKTSARNDAWRRGELYLRPTVHDAVRSELRARDNLDRELAWWGTDARTFWTSFFCFWLALSFGLIITSFCLWNRQSVPGRVLTIAASVMLLPCTCCCLTW
jgi:hypothetical protein